MFYLGTHEVPADNPVFETCGAMLGGEPRHTFGMASVNGPELGNIP